MMYELMGTWIFMSKYWLFIWGSPVPFGKGLQLHAIPLSKKGPANCFNSLDQKGRLLSPSKHHRFVPQCSRGQSIARHLQLQQLHGADLFLQRLLRLDLHGLRPGTPLGRATLTHTPPNLPSQLLTDREVGGGGVTFHFFGPVTFKNE